MNSFLECAMFWESSSLKSSFPRYLFFLVLTLYVFLFAFFAMIEELFMIVNLSMSFRPDMLSFLDCGHRLRATNTKEYTWYSEKMIYIHRQMAFISDILFAIRGCHFANYSVRLLLWSNDCCMRFSMWETTRRMFDTLKKLYISVVKWLVTLQSIGSGCCIDLTIVVWYLVIGKQQEECLILWKNYVYLSSNGFYFWDFHCYSRLSLRKLFGQVVALIFRL